LIIIVYEEDMAFGIGNDINNKIAGLGDLYPNPAHSYTNLEFNLSEGSQVQFFILNQGGQVVEKQMDQYNAGDHLVQLNTASLPSGMYRVMVLIGNEKHIKPFIKVN
jgi:hypothetical protein